MVRIIRKKFLPLFMVFVMVIGLLPTLTLQAKAAEYFATSGISSYSVNVGDYLTMSMYDGNSFIEQLDPSAFCVYFTQPTDGVHTGKIYNCIDNTPNLSTEITSYDSNSSYMIGGGYFFFQATSAGTYSFNIELSDDLTNYTAYTITITVHSVNTAPTFVASGDGTLTVVKNASATDIKNLLHVSDSDSSQTLTWTQALDGAPSHGTLTVTSTTVSSGSTDITPGGTITYTPTADYSGEDSFIVQVSDATDTATRTINVTVDGTAPTASVAMQTVKGSANITVQSTEKGTAYLVSDSLASTAYDTVTELDALVAGGSATKVVISAANTNTTIPAPATSGTYAAVAVDAAGNISSKTANLITVDATAPTASTSTQTVKGGANITVQSTEMGTVYLIGNSLALTAYDTVAKLDALVSGGSATKVTISTASTDTTIMASAVSGTYAAVAVDAVGNISSKTVNLVTVDATVPTASVSTQMVKSGANITVQSTKTGTVYLISNSLASTAYDTVTELDALVSGGSATKVMISTASTDTTLTAPATSGTYAAVAVDGVGNISSKTANLVTVDTISPEVSTINRSNPSSESTNLSAVTFQVTFSESVSGVDISDFTLTTTGTASGTIASVSAASGTTIDVTANSVSGVGTIRLDLNSSETGIADNVGNAISGGYTSGQTYTIDTASPTASVSTQTVKGGANVTVQSTEKGTVYLISDSLASTAYDTVTELDALVSGGSSTKVTIGMANTDMTISVPSTSGVYAAVAVDVAGNISSKTVNLVTVDPTAPTASTSTQTVKGGADVTVQSTETGTAYLISNSLALTAYDTVAKLDALVSGGSATKVTISTASTDTTLTAPATSGTYAAVAVDGVGNISSKTTNLVTVDATVPTASVSTQMVKSGANITVQSTKTGTVYLISNSLVSTAYDTVTELDALVSGGSATKVTISTASTDTTLTAPIASGTYAAVAVDGVGNISSKTASLLTVDATAPTLTSASVSSDYKYIDITFSEGVYGAADGVTALTANKLTVTFTQNSGSATSTTISSIKRADSATEASATALSGGETTIRAFLTVTGTPSGTETITITPKNDVSIFDIVGNTMLSTQTTGAKPLYTPVSSGGGSSSSTDSGAAVIVNGETKTAGTAQTTTNSSGQTITTITVDSSKLENILASESTGATVMIPVTGNSDVAAGTLTGAMVKSMESKAATLVVKTGSGTYTLPASEINIDAVSQQLGTSVSLSDITVTVSIAEPSATMTQVVENAAHNGGYTIMVPAVDYTITCTHGSQTLNVSSFNAYVERTIAIPDGVDPGKVTTGVVVEPDGTTHHVPTRVTVIDGKYYAVINSLTNSTYSVIWNPIEFSDVTNHWAKGAINNMGSRMVVTGVGNNNYDPDRNMTRAEFAAIMVRALGLEPGTGISDFGDITATDWYSGYIKTAYSYGIIKGYDNGYFGPNDTITREQAMAMIARAMAITNLSTGLNNSEISQLLNTFSDGESASAYAKESIAACLKTGITLGTSNTTISPQADITRGEVAVMVERLLQKSNLI